MMTQFTSLEKSLKYFFGYDQFRPGQAQIISDALNNQDLLVIMPTGGGKVFMFSTSCFIKTWIMCGGFSSHCFDAGSS
jgi:ATP-dependent DNA helicase RecQ